MLAEVIDDEATSTDDLVAVGADQGQGAFDQLGGDAAAAQRERQIKEWKRAWKIELIEKDNPHWVDLYPTLSP